MQPLLLATVNMKDVFKGLCLVGLVLIISCTHEPFPALQVSKVIDSGANNIDTSHPIPKSPCSKDTVYFANTIFPLVVSSCATTGCHDAITHHSGHDLTTYAGIHALTSPGKPMSSVLYLVLTQSKKRMPPKNALTAPQRLAIYTWILQNALQNKCTDNSACDSINVKYSTTIAPLLSANCTGCHNASVISGSTQLDTYAGVVSAVNNGQLMGSLIGNLSRMPKYGTALSGCDIGKIRKWISDGAPNN